MLRRAGAPFGGRVPKRKTPNRIFSAGRRGAASPPSVRLLGRAGAALSSLACALFSRRVHTGVGPAEAPDTADEDEVTLQDYEELLLHSAASETPESGGRGDAAQEAAVPRHPNQPPVSATMRLVGDILELLPADGAGIRLTTITPLLDVEAISELFGSVLAFVQLFPHRFHAYQGEEADGVRRWFVSRAQSTGISPPSMAADGVTPAGEGGGGGASNVAQTQLRVRLHGVDAKVDDTKLNLVLQRLKDVLPRNRPTPTNGLLQTLPMELQDSIRDVGGGLLRLLKNAVAEAYVDLSEDTSFVSVKGVLSSQGIPTFHGLSKRAAPLRNAAPVMPLEDYADDAWDVELDLDEDDAVTPGDDRVDDAEPDDEFLRGGGSATAVVPSAAQKQQQRNLSIPPAPPKPPVRLEKPRTPPPLPSRRKEATSSRGRMSPEELLTAHTTMAVLRGRRSPSEMLDLFVECVPTIYVPVHQIKVTDALARVLGPRNTIHKVIKIYSYYFDRNKESDTVRLKSTLQHARLGAANALYEAGSSGASSSTSLPQRKLQETSVTHAFPILNTPIRTKAVSSTIQRKGGPFVNSASDTVAPVDCPMSEWCALLEALPYERYIGVTEWARLAGVAESTVKLFTEKKNNEHYFLTCNTPEKGDETLLWRLRPYWLAPGCTGELGSEDAFEAVAIEKHLKPIWISVDRLLQKLSAPEKDNVLAVSHGSGGVGPWLRKFGRMCWVDKEGTKMRKYCATADLDDILHVVVQYLQGTLPTTFVNLEEKILHDTVSSAQTGSGRIMHRKEGIRCLIDHGLKIARQQALSSQPYAGQCSHEKRAKQENLYLLLKRHPQQVNAKYEEGILWAAKHSFFGRHAEK
ncbi:uncharacterized protein Tco025E_07942 [Trypanosoma conorhini]|uniref:Uncharacterized protein n=1 Tax=Trypanosoma conorhini TaxID=83891 RepID=A0A422NGE1_9TRYP|nr:uncharacterized protein Tco025E_07942 [Trypanosoma conorhini]RNF04530.1 hypothetical protein Tco025E_07942 [Trypanosoma conorhini]